jgi:hypothetical protein
MKWLTGIFLLALVCIFPAQATVFPCSADSASGMFTGSGMQDMGAIIMKTIPTGALVTLDPGLITTYTGPSTVALGEDPGIHSFTVSMPGYQDYSGQFTICTQKLTYVTISLTPGTTTTVPPVRLARPVRTTTPPTTVPGAGITSAPDAGTTAAVSGGSSPEVTGSLSVESTPSGAVVYLDGVQKAVSPAVIPGISPGDHTVQLKMAGYKVLSTSIRIRAGDTAEFSSGLIPDAPATTVTAAVTTTTVTTAVPPTASVPVAEVPTAAKTPGFAIFTGIGAITLVLALRQTPR